jgi:hypothetical protein
MRTIIMKRIECTVFAFVIGSLCLSQVAAGGSDSRKIDGAHSTVTVHVYKSGFLSPLVTIMKFRLRSSPVR